MIIIKWVSSAPLHTPIHEEVSNREGTLTFITQQLTFQVNFLGSDQRFRYNKRERKEKKKNKKKEKKRKKRKKKRKKKEKKEKKRKRKETIKKKIIIIENQKKKEKT